MDRIAAGHFESFDHESAPWIEKLDLSGAVVWKRTIAEDEDKVLSIPFDSSSRTCAGIQVSASGDIAWQFRKIK